MMEPIVSKNLLMEEARQRMVALDIVGHGVTAGLPFGVNKPDDTSELSLYELRQLVAHLDVMFEVVDVKI